MSLDLGALIGHVILEDTTFETTYVRVVRKMADLGAHAEGAASGTSMLDRALAEAAVSAADAAAATGAVSRATLMEADAAMAAAAAESTRAAKATATSAALLREVEASDAATAATTRTSASATTAALAESKLTQARLRAGAAQDRLTALQASGTASARQLAAAQAALIAATDRVAVSEEHAAQATILGARTAERARTVWASIPGPVKAVVAAVTAVGVLSLGAATHFQDATTRIQTQADASRQQVDALRAGILAMTAAVATSPDTLANAAYHIASVGQKSMTTAQELAVLRVAAEGAKLGHANLVDVTNALDAAIVANMKGVRDYAQVMGVMNATVGAGDMSMQDFADAFGPLGSTFKGFGVTIQQAGAALATFGDNNLRGADAGTQLRMSITALAVPMKAGREQLREWGISSGDLSKQLAHGGLTEALTVLAKLLRQNGISADEMGPKLAEMFGKRGPQQGLSTLINQLGRYESKLHEVTTGGDTFTQRWADYTKTLAYAWDRIGAGAEAAAVKIGNRLLPDATRAVSWLGTTGASDVAAFWHALTTNPEITAGLHDIISAAGHLGGALHDAAETAAPLARILVTLGAAAVLVTFRLLAAVLNDVATGLADVAGFFDHNHAAAEALAFILATALVPAALAAGKALLWTGLEATAAGIGKILTGSMGLVTGLKAMGASAILARAGVVLLAVEVFNAIGDFTRLDAAADKLRTSLDKPLQGNVFQDLAKDSAQGTAALSTNIANAMSAWDAFKTGFAHPVHALGIITGAGDDQVNKMQDQIGAALGNIHSLSQALYGLNAAPLDAESKISAVINAMHLSVSDLATKDFPGLVANVQAWIAANQAANTPAAQAAKALLAMSSGAQAATMDLQDLKIALDGFAGKALTADEAAVTFRNRLAQLDTALKASKGSLSLNTAVGRDARQEFDTTAQAALDLAAAMKDSGKSTATVRAALKASIAMLQAHAGASGYAKQGLAELNAVLDALPATVAKSGDRVKHAAPKFAAPGNTMLSSIQTALNSIPGLIAKQDAKMHTGGVTLGKSLTDGLTIAIQQGSGRVNLVTERMVKGVLHVARGAAEANSPSKATVRLGADIADGLPIGYLARQPQVLAAVKQGTTATMYAVTQAVHGMLTQANSRLSADVAAKASAASTIKSGITGNYGLAGAIGPNGNVGNLSAYFGGGATTLARELTLLNRLRAKHLAPGLLAEIAGLAPKDAIAAATSILSGASGSITTLDRNYEAVARYAGKLGNTIASAQFDQMIDHDKKALIEAKETNAILRELVAEYKKQPKALAAAIDSTIRGAAVHH